MSKYLRSYVLLDDPGFSGSLRDFVNQGEKLGMIDDATAWMRIRELRNLSSHEYNEKDLTHFFQAIKTECPKLLAITNLVDTHP